MTSTDYRIESSHTLACRLLPAGNAKQLLVGDRALAVVLAAKSTTWPAGEEIRVVHVPTGEIVFRKAASPRADWTGEA